MFKYSDKLLSQSKIVMGKNVLKIEYELESKLIGLVCQAEDFKLAWALNKLLKINFTKQKDHTITFKNNQILMVSHFLYSTENVTLQLLKNKAVDQSALFLVPELKNIDYFFLIDDETGDWDSPKIKQELQMCNLVHYAQIIDSEKLKSKENLII